MLRIRCRGLAKVYEKRGRYPEAERLQREALESAERALGADHPSTLASRNNLGGLLTKMGRYDDARTMLQQALRDRIRVLGTDHWHLGYSYYNLGCLAAATGDRAEALEQLTLAVGSGWSERDILEDTSLDPLRGDSEFEALVDEVEKIRN